MTMMMSKRVSSATCKALGADCDAGARARDVAFGKRE